MKTCRKCGVTKKLDQFHKHRITKDGLRSTCKECTNAYSRAWRAANPERKRENNRSWREANPDRQRELRRAWNAANPERKREHLRSWKSRNPDKVTAHRHRRRARQKWAVPQRLRRHEDHPQHLCYYCGKRTRVNVPPNQSDKRHIDHITPIAKGGPATPSNEVPACHSCNLAKSDKSPWLWMAEQF